MYFCIYFPNFNKIFSQISGLISVISFKRTIKNISYNITNLQDNYLGTYVSMGKVMSNMPMAAVLTYLCTLSFLLRASA